MSEGLPVSVELSTICSSSDKIPDGHAVSAPAGSHARKSRNLWQGLTRISDWWRTKKPKTKKREKKNTTIAKITTNTPKQIQSKTRRDILLVPPILSVLTSELCGGLVSSSSLSLRLAGDVVRASGRGFTLMISRALDGWGRSCAACRSEPQTDPAKRMLMPTRGVLSRS